jgi:hypothetical protein
MSAINIAAAWAKEEESVATICYKGASCTLNNNGKILSKPEGLGFFS